MRTILAFCLASIVAVPTYADTADEPRSKDLVGRRVRNNLGSKITAQTLAASRSFELERELVNEAWGLILLYVQITDADNGEVGVSVDCTASEDNNTTDYRIPACVWDSINTRFNCEEGPMFWDPSDETSPKKQLFRVDIEGTVDIECTFAFTTASASDSIDVTVVLSAKGG